MVSRIKLIAQVFSAVLAVYLGFFAFEPPSAIQFIKHAGYWILFTAVLLSLYAGTRVYLESSFRVDLSFLRRQRTPLLVILGLSLTLYLLQENGYKVVNDEPVLAATALQMHHEKEAMTATRGYNIGGTFNLLGGYVGKRPYFYPFLVSVLHDLTGYRSNQGVVLNHLLTPLFLGLLYMIGHRLGSVFGGYFALSLCATVPLFAINANGGGFDLLNAVMLLATLWASMLYLGKRTDARLNLMIVLAVLLAQTRYESASYVVAVVGIVLLAWFRDKRMQLTWISIAVPLLLICVPLQNTIFEQYPELWQLNKSGTDAAFAFSMIPENLRHALNFFFKLFPIQAGSSFLSSLFCFALMGGLYLAARGRFRSFLKSTDAPAILCFFALMVGNFFLMMAYHWGQADDIVATRIIIPFILFQILFVVVVVRHLPFNTRVYQVGIIGSAVFFFAVIRPECSRTDYLVRLVDQRVVAWVVDEVRERKGQDFLFITDKHPAVMAEQESSLPQILAAKAKREIDLHLRLGTFPEAIVFYKMIESAEGKGDWRPETPIEKDFDIEIIEEVKLADSLYVRMGRVRGVTFREGDRPPYDESTLSKLADPELGLSVFAKTLP